jgi:hypothetical protein
MAEMLLNNACACVPHTILSFGVLCLLYALPRFCMGMINRHLKLLECNRVVCQPITKLQVPLGLKVPIN